MISFVMGLPGAGKTTFLTWCCITALADKSLEVGHFSYKRPLGDTRHYRRVFSNIPIDGTYKLDFEMLGKYEYDNVAFIMSVHVYEVPQVCIKCFPVATIGKATSFINN